MKPYYEQDGITIYHGDCREVLPGISADVLLTDPPCGISFSSSMGGRFTGNRIQSDQSTELRDWVLEQWRGPALVFGSWKTSTPQGTHTLLVWDKGTHVGMGNLSVPWKPNHEFIYVIGQGFSGHRGSGVLRINAQSPNFVEQLHPTEKPILLLVDLVSKVPPGASILDPFAGSGTTLVAAKQLGRRAIGIEIEQKYCDIAIERLRQEVLPLVPMEPDPVQDRLFGPRSVDWLRVLGEQDECREAALQRGIA